MVKNKMQWWLEFNNILPKSQTGFRKGQSTTDNLTGLTLNVEDSFSNKKDLLAAFLDVQGAFDNVNINILLQQLATIGCHLKLVKFIKFLTQERYIFTEINGKKFNIIYKGVPQGGVLSPLLFNIYVAQVCENLPKTVTVSQFADDIALYCKRGSTSTSKRLLEKAIEKVNQNLNNLGLELSAHKTIFIHFNRRNIKPGETEITVNNTPIKSSETARFLGITFDYTLSFKQQTNLIINRASRALNIVKFLRGTWWGAHPNILTLFYKSFVRSIIDYGCFIYFPTQADALLKLERIQYKSIRLALGYRASTPTNILLAESKLPLLIERSKYLCHSYLNKIYSNKELSLNQTITNFNRLLTNKDTSHRKFSNRIFQTCIENTYPSKNKIYSKNNFPIYTTNYAVQTINVNVNTEIGQKLKKSNDPNSVLNKIISENRNANIIFTDGSKSADSISVGSACFHVNKNKFIVRSIDKVASIFTAECLAINDAVDIALEYPNQRCFIFSDSLSALLSLKNYKNNVKTNPLLLEIREKIYEFQKKAHKDCEIVLVWIPAHLGINGNEKADQLAKEAANSASTDIYKIPFTDFKEIAKKKSIENTFDSVKSQGQIKGTEYFKNYYKDSSKPWYFKINLPREIISTINRCRAGHYNLAFSLARIGVKDNSHCECGDENQTINHILWNCSLYDQERQPFIRKLQKLKFSLPTSCATLLANPNTRICKAIYTI
ncbi:uncharacterized protein LOC131673537 [Phymastichus coffea]|uniref:uncharacterized protein LOC131673537 n=1 Tax=Phymastichus coffea TaxID=108790 RepID=UPI00273CE915|nr:uncharacterized protein LOC131673537 [Phymastichus coffea]